jgi:hypothetical protein
MKISISNIFESFVKDNIDLLIIFGHDALDETNATFKDSQFNTNQNKLTFGDYAVLHKNQDINNTSILTICDLNNNREGFTNEKLIEIFTNTIIKTKGKYKNVGILTPTPIGYTQQNKSKYTYEIISLIKTHFADKWIDGEVTLYTMTW